MDTIETGQKNIYSQNTHQNSIQKNKQFNFECFYFLYSKFLNISEFKKD